LDIFKHIAARDRDRFELNYDLYKPHVHSKLIHKIAEATISVNVHSILDTTNILQCNYKYFKHLQKAAALVAKKMKTEKLLILFLLENLQEIQCLNKATLQLLSIMNKHRPTCNILVELIKTMRTKMHCNHKQSLLLI